MTPAAHVQAAIEVIDAWQASADGLDKVLARWARSHRFAGSGDRAAIADQVYATVRRLRSAGWVSGAEQPNGRDLLRGSLILDNEDPVGIFTGQGYAPAALGPLEQNTHTLSDAPRAVRCDFPDWMDEHFSEHSDELLDALRSRAPLDLRVNLLKGTRAAALDALAKQGIDARPSSISPTAMRVTTGARKFAQSDAYKSGLIEIQDAASQAVVDHADARPGMAVLDLCAGGGGKTLAMAAAMANQGRLMAYDISPDRLAALTPRADRAGARIETLSKGDLETFQGACDLVLVDAPCSGSGAWRRNPDAKWQFTPNRLQDLTNIQQSLLSQAADLTAPKGRIAYVTCSLLSIENTDAVDSFLRQNASYRLVDQTAFTPLDGTDGFFIANFERN